MTSNISCTEINLNSTICISIYRFVLQFKMVFIPRKNKNNFVILCNSQGREIYSQKLSFLCWIILKQMIYVSGRKYICKGYIIENLFHFTRVPKRNDMPRTNILFWRKIDIEIRKVFYIYDLSYVTWCVYN